MSENPHTENFLILGPSGQVGTDLCHYFDKIGVPNAQISQRISDLASVLSLVKDYPDHTFVNLAFNKNLEDSFTNVDLPVMLDRNCTLPPVHLSSNAVYGITPRIAGTGDTLDGFNPYARVKIKAEAGLRNSIIIRGSFLSSSHRLFQNCSASFNFDAIWNGISVFEFARLLQANKFKLGIQTVASEKTILWKDLAKRFSCSATHDPDLPKNLCVLRSDIEGVSTLEKQLAELDQITLKRLNS